MIPPNWIWGLASAVIAGLTLIWVNRALGRVDGIEKAQQAFGDRLHAIELQMAKDLATKEDVNEVERRLESVAVTLGEVRDLVIRLDAQKPR